MLEFVVDTSRAAVNLLFSGALERYPNIHFILAHGGGVIPYIAWRLSVAPMISPQLPAWPQQKIFDDLRRFWYDTALCATRHSLPSADGGFCARAGALWQRLAVRTGEGDRAEHRRPREATAVSDRTRDRIERDNALALFPRFQPRNRESPRK